MKNKILSYILLVLFVLSTLSVQGIATTSPTDDGQRQVTTDQTQIQQSDPSSGFEELVSQTNSDDTISSSISEETSMNSFAPDYSQYLLPSQSRDSTSYQGNPMVELSENLFSWTNLQSELQSQGVSIPSGLNYAEDAIIHYDDKGIEYIITTKDGKISIDLASLMEQHGVKMKKSYPNQNFHVITVPSVSMESFVTAAESMSEVTLIEPNFYAQLSYVPNDPEYAAQYGPQIIGMETAWDLELGSTDILVAVIDTGIDYNHSDLGNYLPLGYDHYNQDNDPWDDHGHGTHVAGTIGATINNALGVAGVANVSFFAEKFLDEFGFGSSADGAAAIMHAVDSGADILSNSWGGSGYSQQIADAVDYALANNVMVIAAAGNSASSNYHYPAALPGVMAVSATNQNDQLAGFSNYGDWIDIAAPGVDILSTLPFDSYGFFSGTSMATPHVSGLLALLMSAFPEYTPSQLENLLYSTATDLGDPGFDELFGNGRIDASVAIYGIQDHDVRAEVSLDNTVPNGEDVIVEYGVTNLGLMNESNVVVSLTDSNGSLVIQETIAFLASGESYFNQVNFGPLTLGTYNYTVSVDQVDGETVINNNVVSASTSVTDPIINPQVGDILRYGTKGDSIPFQFSWEVVDTSDPSAVVIAEFIYDAEFDDVILIAEHTLNTFTREFSAYWSLFPYWINPDVEIGDVIDLFSIGGQEGEVIGEDTYNHFGAQVDVWVVDDGFELVLFDKTSGALVSVQNYSNMPYFSIEVTNVFGTTANVMIALDNNPVGSPGENVTIDVFVYNTGDLNFEEFVTLDLVINDNITAQTEVVLPAFAWTVATLSFVPNDYGIYNVTIGAQSLPSETYFEDNVFYTLVNIVDLQNYEFGNPQYTEYDAVTNGFNLDLYGDDVSTSLTLPFSFNFYDGTFDTIYIGSNGWMSFEDTSPTDYFPQPFPSEEYPYAIAPFFSDLVAEGNVYAWTTPDFVVIEYVDYYYLWGDLLGTFEVVLFPNGDILFQYEYITYEDFNEKGINYGLNLNYYTVVPDDLSGVNNYAGLFTLGELPPPPPPTETGPDLAAGLSYPQLNPGESEFITASVTNVGTERMFDVQVFLSIDGQVVGQSYTEILNIGDTLEYNYLWMNMEYGIHQLEVQVVEQDSEIDHSNNYISEDVFVSDEHDLWVGLNVYQDQNNYYLDAFVYNNGYLNERNVELYIFIDGQVVTFGVIETLDVGTGSAISYLFANPTPGTYNITAFAPLIGPELDEENNVQTQIITVQAPVEDVFALQLYDNTTMEPVPYAYVYMYSFEHDLNINTETNSTGGLTLEIPGGEYYLYIQADGYATIDTNVWVDGYSYYEILLTPLSIEERLIVQVSDSETLEPVPYAQYYLYGYNTGYYLNGQANESGIIDILLPLDTFDLQIQATGYENYWDSVYVDGEVFIDVYLQSLVFDSQLALSVFDANTLEPVSNVEVNLYGSSTGYQVVANTNDTGNILVDLPTDNFYIDIYDNRFENYFDSIYVSGFVHYEIYLSPIMVDSTLEIQFLNEQTSEPVAGAYVFLSGLNTGYELNLETDLSGFILAELPEDEYWIYVMATGYESTDFYEYVSGYTSLVHYLVPVSQSQETIEITSPSNGDHFDEGYILVEYQTSAQLEGLIVYLNSTYLTEIRLMNGQLLVPIFGEAFWEITLEGIFYDGSSSDTVTIHAGPLENNINLEIGDYFYLFADVGGGDFIEISFIVVDMLTEDIAYINATITQSSGDFYDQRSGYLIVYLPNGYVFESDIGWMGSHFYYLDQNMNWDNDDPSNNYVVSADWGAPILYSNTSLFNGVSVDNYFTPDGTHIGYYSSTGGLAIFDIPGFNVTIDTSLTPSVEPPNLSSPEDRVIEYSAVNETISWNIEVYDNANYTIQVNGETVESGIIVGNTVSFNITGLPVGDFNIELTVTDEHGQSSSDTVLVTVVDTTAPVIVNDGALFEIFQGEDLEFTIEVEEDHPGYFMIYINDVQELSGTWSGNEIPVTLSGLQAGQYQLDVVLADAFGNNVTGSYSVTVLVPDHDAPDLRGPTDFTYEVNSTDNYIVWEVYDDSSATYSINLNGEIYEQGSVEGDEIELLIDGLSEGRHNFTITVVDEFGNSNSDTVIVYVIPIDDVPPPAKLNGFTSVFAILGIFATVFTIRRRSSL